MLDLNSPLGLDRKPQKRGGYRSRAFRWLGLVAALAVVGGASAAVWRFNHAAFRKPEPVVAAAAPQAAPAAEPAKAPPVVAGNTPPPGSAARAGDGKPGPAIIRVAPDMPTPTPGGEIMETQNLRKPGQDARVAALPEKELIEPGEVGPLPVRGPDGLRPMDAYAAGWSGARGPRIALVIGGLGLSQTGSMQAIEKLPGEITLGFSPQGNSLQRWMQAARQKGHELVLQLPMEPFDYPRIDPGRNTLTVAADADGNRAALLRSLARMTNYAGVMNYMGARFTAEGDALNPVLREIAARGLYYLDDGASARSQADRLAREDGTPFAAADILIDAAQDRGTILDRLDELERTARANGSAIGTGSAFGVTVDAVAEWAAQVQKRGIEIVPVSALVRDPERR